MHFHPLADAHQWRISLANVGDEPDGRQTADRVDRTGGADRGAVDELAEPDLALRYGAADRRRHDRDRIQLLRGLGFERGDFLVALAEDAQSVAHRGERDLVAANGVLRRDEIGLGLLPVFESAALRHIQVMRTLLVGLRLRELRACCLQIGKRSDQVVLHLHELARLDFKQRCAGLDMIAELGDQFDDPPRIGRKYRRGQIVVDCDAAFRHLFGTEADETNRLDLEPRQLLFGRPKGPARGRRQRRLRTPRLIGGILPDYRPDEDSSANKKRQEGDQNELGKWRHVPAQQGHLPDILCQMLTNAATSLVLGSGPVLQLISGISRRLTGGLLPEDSVDRQRTEATHSGT